MQGMIDFIRSIYLLPAYAFNALMVTSLSIGSWWRHQMETFSTLLALCVRNPPVTGESPSQRAVTRYYDVFLDLRLKKRLSKQSRRRWLETPSRSLCRRCNVVSRRNSEKAPCGLQITHLFLIKNTRYPTNVICSTRKQCQVKLSVWIQGKVQPV